MTSVTRLSTTGLLALSLFAAVPSATAGPGAHGPNGEHLDAPTQPAPAGTSAPRFEARTETFELVGRLQGGELSVFLNRFETNEPVLAASVELETGNVKAKAPFHADHGDYSVDDKAFLEAVSRPGEHPVVIMVVAGAEADLLEATLTVPAKTAAAADTHDHPVWTRRTAVLGALGLALAVPIAWALARRRRRTMALPEATR